MDAGLGQLEPQGAGWRLTFVRRFPQPPDVVWGAVTEAERLSAWFPQRIVGEWRTGAVLRFELDGGDGFDGEVVRFDPPRSYELRWGTDRLSVAVEPDGDGTRLTLTDTFDERGKGARDAAGWHECLAHLAEELAGVPLSAPGEVWQAMHPVYVGAFGPEASTIGPPG
jgi:uncharacterized protein YndB with AHSA1/START domain